ncbi:MAG: hypothetical protein WDN50_22285 [Bradyrhizobium sp.]
MLIAPHVVPENSSPRDAQQQNIWRSIKISAIGIVAAMASRDHPNCAANARHWCVRRMPMLLAT